MRSTTMLAAIREAKRHIQVTVTEAIASQFRAVAAQRATHWVRPWDLPDDDEFLD
jgi:phage baseplate assembly protein gpV